MKIAVIGLGFVGLVTALALAHDGNKIIGIDIDKKKINNLLHGVLPFFEPGLEKLLTKNRNNISFSTDFSLISGSKATFIIVPTPTIKNKISLQYVFSAARAVRKVDKSTTLVIKSTVIPGTADKIRKLTNLHVVSNPEFTREGSAVSDTLHPDRIVIGGTNKKDCELVSSIWRFTNAPVLITSNENAELIKYGNNSLLATLISFGNQLSNVSEKIPHTDMEIILKGMSMDKRISCCKSYLTPGIGFGGSCFPKDTKALLALSKDLGQKMSIIEDTIKTNEERINHIIKIIKETKTKINPNLRVGILGLAFKENTDDLRESPSIKLIKKLIKLGVGVNAYDPLVKSAPVEGPEYFLDLSSCIANSDLLIIANRSKEFIKIEKMNIKIPVIDGRRLLNKDKIKNYIAIGLSRTKKR